MQVQIPQDTPVHIRSKQSLESFIESVRQSAMKDAQISAKRIAETEFKLAEFELLYSAVVDKNESKKNLSYLKAHREAEWKKALEKAGGDEEKAIFLYGEV